MNVKDSLKLTYGAVRRGLLTPQPCKVCGTSFRITAWLPDYNYPMQVVWLCREHLPPPLPTSPDPLNRSKAAEAYQITGWAVRYGILVPQACEVCGNPKTDAHHQDYAQPLRVRWLCRKHHMQTHKGGKRRVAGKKLPGLLPGVTQMNRRKYAAAYDGVELGFFPTAEAAEQAILAYQVEHNMIISY